MARPPAAFYVGADVTTSQSEPGRMARLRDDD